MRALPRQRSILSRRSIDDRIDTNLSRTNRTVHHDSEWKGKDVHGFEWREVRTRVSGTSGAKGKTGEPAVDHIGRYALRSDMLVICEGSFPNEAARKLIEQAIASVTTLK